MEDLHRPMGQRSRNRYPLSTLFKLLPLRRLRVAPVVAGLSLLLATGCDRAVWEEAFAPGPQPGEGAGTDIGGTTSGEKSSGNSSKSTAPGGAVAGSDRKTPEATSSKPQTGPGGGSNPRLAGDAKTSSSDSSSDDNKPKPSDSDESSSQPPAAEIETSDNASANARGNGDSSNSNREGVPSELESSVADVLALGVLTPPDQAAVDAGFEPNEPVTRGEFARWLLAANNVIYGDRPAAQIRIATGSSEPIFKDVAKNNPNFPAIQGLAEAGIIPSSLSGAQEQINFKPDALLTREDMLLWKVPLDTRQSLPASNLEAVKEAWGFQDASKASAPALRAILADYSNGDQAVIRRVFGYTTLLQPQKAVTQAEAAAALWYFGNSGQGVSAGDVSTGELGEVEGNENIGG